MSSAESQEILLRGPEELADEKNLIGETVEDIGRTVGEELEPRQVEPSDFEEDELNDIYRELDGSRGFEQEFEREEGGLAGGDMTSVLILQPYTDDLFETPVMYITDRPLFVEDRETGETSHVYGATQPSHHRPATAMSTFAFKETEEELHDELLKTLTYHEAGHLLNQESDREYRDENRFGGGHCPNPDVMNGQNIMEDTRNRYENNLYCEACTEEIRKGIERLQ